MIADSATIENADLGENVHVMANAHVTDSSLSGSIVFPETRVDGCTVQDSIVDRGTHIEDLDLAGALIGAHTEITNDS